MPSGTLSSSCATRPQIARLRSVENRGARKVGRQVVSTVSTVSSISRRENLMRVAKGLSTLVLLLCLNVKGSFALVDIGKIGKIYQAAVQNRPFTTYCVQGAVVSATGDVASQMLTRKKDSGLSGSQTYHATVSGVVFNGVLLPWYYDKIQNLIPGRTPVMVGLKVAFDQLLWGYGGNFAMITVRRWMEGTRGHAKKEIWPVFRSDLVVWTTYNTLCYGVIPRNLQPISTAVMAAAWTAYISTVSMKDIEGH